MAKVGRIKARQRRAPLVKGTGHGRTPIAHGSAGMQQPGVGGSGAGRSIAALRAEKARLRAANRKRTQAQQRRAEDRRRREAGLPPAPHKTWGAFKRADPEGYRKRHAAWKKGSVARTAKKAAWKRWRAEQRRAGVDSAAVRGGTQARRRRARRAKEVDSLIVVTTRTGRKAHLAFEGAKRTLCSERIDRRQQVGSPREACKRCAVSRKTG